MFDKFLEIGSCADLITPLVAYIQDVYHGSSFQINLPEACGYSAVQIQNALEEKGIYVWGVMVVGKTITFSVRETQARYALYWLDRWGVPVEGHSKLKGLHGQSPKMMGLREPKAGENDRHGSDSILNRLLDQIDKFTI